MVYVGYCGENLENFKIEGETGAGFPGLFFYYGYSEAKKIAEINGNKVFIAECELNKIKDNESGLRLFDSFSDVMIFIHNYLPEWINSEGDLLDSKDKLVKELLSSYVGHYDLVRLASEASGSEVAEILDEIGIDSITMPYGFAITSPTQILSYQEVDHQLTNEEVESQSLPEEEDIPEREAFASFEAKSNDYIRKAKQGKPYKTKPGNRFLRRVKIRTLGGNSTWFDIDINRLFKKNSFAVKIPVIGETDEYTCTISFEDWLPKLKADILNNGFTQMTVKKSLAEMMRFNDLKVRCTCSDFCLTGETKVKLLDGRILSMAEIVEESKVNKDLWVYSSDERGDFHPGLIKEAFKTKEALELVEVELDSGETIRCTPEHRFMLRDGSYLEAGSLVKGQSLMPMYLRPGKKNYEQVKLNSKKTTTYKSVYRLVANEIYVEEIANCKARAETDSQDFEYEVAIHHKDFHKENNTPSNLQPMTAKEHWELHHNLVKENGVLEKFLEGGKKYWSTEEARRKQSEVAKKSLVPWLNSLTVEEKKEFYSKARSLINKDKLRASLLEGASRRWGSMTKEERAEYANRSINKPGVHNSETYKKQGASLSRYLLTLTDEERRAKYGKNLGKQLSDETRAKISNSHLGLKLSVQVERVCGFSKKELKTLDCKKANLAVRNFPERVDTLQKRLKISDGGATYLFATTLHDESRVLVVCTKVDKRD